MHKHGETLALALSGLCLFAGCTASLSSGGASSQGVGGASGQGSGGSVTCDPGTTLCAGACVDTSMDAFNCGACGNRCAQGETCVSGACSLVCPTGSTPCGGVCADTLKDPQNCGGCGVVCASPSACAGGSCVGVPMAGLNLWLRADRGVVTGGGAVQKWLDQSGKGNHAYAPSPSAAPTLAAAGIKSKPSVHFDGTSSFLIVPDSPSLDFGTSADFSVVLVVRAGPAKNPLTGIVSKGQHTDPAFHAWQIHVRGNSSSFAEEIIADPFPGIASPSMLDIQDGVPRIMSVIFQRNPGHVRAYGDGATIQSQALPELTGDLTTPDPLRLGTERSELNFMQGDLAELLIYEAALDDPDRIAVETYLSSKYGIPTVDNP